MDRYPQLTSLFSILTGFFFVGMFVLSLVGCATKTSTIILATTTSTMDSGLLDVLLAEFTKRTGIQVKPIAVGTGEAMAMGERGEADVLLVHAREAEDKFMAEGFGAVRKDVMHNDFVLIGLVSDPAGIRGLESARDAFQSIAGLKSLFISRGDDSGTYKKELQIWKEAGITPQGEWYIESGQGMGETIRIADEKGAYILSDRGTYLSLKDTIRLEVLVEGDEILFNPYGVIAVNPEKFPHVNFQGAMEFIEFITSVEGQNIIKNFGVDKYGEPLFYPDALE
ncbi:tungstate transport system substrate-binding protein [Candidatus Hakubella thermalkaliphila]|uniref:Tungstate transport system substrate-binding protein n=2 Tax=Candidatus Hakubella thermalkaliphila TaxID=2754717 RepID=A0A6V8QGG5_9ACTN|nr:substrate-binding domain-containing protein [Candidatus Hakubella thermalkaliphila]GFP27773.1 tungstate transport system substrate-binding protein [Candidatus Hakubella thermalkaliphila]GFP35034.1 tungstate transport system substrate-binding protein [Candidatus Hakubella thermalkaliphila]GFP43862.1 tungstate transport system substrate-binding protein [Candidatus Hakubella thermalkaliphila]